MSAVAKSLIAACLLVIAIGVVLLVTKQDDQPKQAPVVTIAGQALTDAGFDRLVAIQVRDAQQNAALKNGVLTPIDPPSFKKCVASLAKINNKISVAKRQKTCANTFDQAQQIALRGYIGEQWLLLEGKRRHWTFTNAQINRELQRREKAYRQAQQDNLAATKKIKNARDRQQVAARIKAFNQRYPTQAAYAQAIGITPSAQRQTALATVIQNKLLRDVYHLDKPITAAQIKQAYQQNKASLTAPDKYRLQALITQSLSDGKAALDALQHGQSWQRVNARYGTTKNAPSNGVLTITSAKLQPQLAAAIKQAPTGKWAGPVVAGEGFVVFRKLATSVGKTTPFNQIKNKIKASLEQQRAQQAGASLRQRWQTKTLCRATLAVETCKNYQPPKDTVSDPKQQLPNVATTSTTAP